LKTDARNQRSRRAIEGLGARFEGVPAETGRRHTCLARKAGCGTAPCFSVTDAEVACSQVRAWAGRIAEGGTTSGLGEVAFRAD